MNAPIRLVLGVAVVVPLAVCLLGLHSGFDPFDFHNSLRIVHRGEELEQWLQFTLRHRRCKEQVVQEVIAQRWSLREGLEQLQEMDREWLQEAERKWPDDNRDLGKTLRFCWGQPDWRYSWFTTTVKILLFDRPMEADVVLRRLAKEYQQLQAGKETTSTSESPEQNKKESSNILRPFW